MSDGKNSDWLDDFADSLDPLHLDDTFFGNGDGVSSFDEMMIAEESDDSLCENRDETNDNNENDEKSIDECSFFKESISPTDNAEVINPINIRLTVSFSEPQRTAPTDGMWKYYNESWKSWDFAQALIDYFPELASDYESNSYSTLSNIIKETYEIDKIRATNYLLWLWENFPREFFKDEQDGAFERPSFRCRGQLIQTLMIWNEHDAFLYEQLKSDAFLQAAFIDGIMEKHDEFFSEKYIDYLLSFNDFFSAEKAYRLFLEGQRGRYGQVDLGKMWDGVVMSIMYNHHLEEKDKKQLFLQISPLVKEIGERGIKVMKSIDENIKAINELSAD